MNQINLFTIKYNVRKFSKNKKNWQKLTIVMQIRQNLFWEIHQILRSIQNIEGREV